jgi:hypothetical protein
VIEKYESQRIRCEIREVLLNIWDPIGVGHVEEARDEYDGYIGRVYALMTEGGSDEQIVEYLLWAINERMALRASREQMEPTLRALRSIKLPPPS